MYQGYCKIKERYRRRIANRKYTQVDWDPDGELGGGALSGYVGIERGEDGKRRWILPVARHACDFGDRPSWRPWYFIHPSLNRNDQSVVPKEVCLEVQVKLLVPIDVRDLWTAKVPIKATLPFRAPLDEWLGAGIRLEGDLVLRGERPRRRVSPVVEWEKQGEWLHSPVYPRPTISNIRFTCHATYTPRADVELWGLCLRWVPEVEELAGWDLVPLEERKGVVSSSPRGRGLRTIGVSTTDEENYDEREMMRLGWQGVGENEGRQSHDLVSPEFLGTTVGQRTSHNDSLAIADDPEGGLVGTRTTGGAGGRGVVTNKATGGGKKGGAPNRLGGVLESEESRGGSGREDEEGKGKGKGTRSNRQSGRLRGLNRGGNGESRCKSEGIKGGGGSFFDNHLIFD